MSEETNEDVTPVEAVPQEVIPQTKSPDDAVRDAVSGLTREQMDSFNEFINGPGYDPSPLRRHIRSRGGHCSGGGGAC